MNAFPHLPGIRFEQVTVGIVTEHLMRNADPPPNPHETCKRFEWTSRTGLPPFPGQ